jgi:nucleolar protein 56
VAVELVSTFDSAYALERGTIVNRFDAPTELEPLFERLRLRRDGRRTPEELQLLATTKGLDRFTRDRRLAVEGVRLEPRPVRRREALLPAQFGPIWRELLLRDASETLTRTWDPSVHVDEAVRSLADYDEVLNLLGERLESWSTRADTVPGVGPEPSPELLEARKRLGELRAAVHSNRTDLEHTLERVTPELAPNLSGLLGPLLAARLISRAGGLARLARLPASTIQVLGAERAFFEHLRGRAPPPRHGLLFIHPDVQGAPRAVRGRIARALAGKAAIAARLDLARRPLDPRLLEAFKERSRRARSPRSTRRRPR